MITVKDASGNEVINMKKTSLYHIKGSFISEPINLKLGEYKLTEFMVVDEDDNVLYITPKKGSEREHLVTKPLPIHFNVTENDLTEVNVQVVRAEGEPADFGYASFSIDVVNSTQFRVQAFTPLEAGFAQYEEQNGFKLIPAKIELYRATEEKANKIFEGSITTEGDNWFDIPDTSTPILVKISNVNYQTYRETFTPGELMKFTNQPLKAILREHEFKQLVEIEEEILRVYVPKGDPDKLLFVTWENELYKVDVSDLDNPGTPVFIGVFGTRFAEDRYGKLFLGNYFSTDMGETWEAVTTDRPVRDFVEFKGDYFGLKGNFLYRETGVDQWELVKELDAFNGNFTDNPELLAYDNKIFAEDGLLVSEDGINFTETMDMEDFEVSWYRAGSFTAMGNLYMKTEAQGIFGTIYKWNDNTWESVYEYDAEFGSPLFSGVYDNKMVMVELNSVKIFNECDVENCEPIYSNFFRWDPNQMPPATIFGRHIRAGILYIQTRVTNDGVDHLFALDLKQIEFRPEFTSDRNYRSDRSQRSDPINMQRNSLRQTWVNSPVSDSEGVEDVKNIKI